MDLYHPLIKKYVIGYKSLNKDTQYRNPCISVTKDIKSKYFINEQLGFKGELLKLN